MKQFLLHGGGVRHKDERHDGFSGINEGLEDDGMFLSIGSIIGTKPCSEYFERDKKLLFAQAKANIGVVDASYSELD
jgi:hypothetical protein